MLLKSHRNPLVLSLALILALLALNPLSARSIPSTITKLSSEVPKKTQRWLPLESNSTLINDYIQKIGFDTSLYEFVDIFSTEDWALDMTPQPVTAVLLLYPLTDRRRKEPACQRRRAS
jgi:hypothetical protein